MGKCQQKTSLLPPAGRHPRSLQADVLKYLHDNVNAGHLGINKTISRVKRHFYWYRMKESVKLWIRNCTKCGSRKSPVNPPKAGIRSYQVGAPLDRVCTDILGPFPCLGRGNKYILLVGDYFTRWIEAYAIPDCTAKTVADKLVYEYFCRLGYPLDLHSDQG